MILVKESVFLSLNSEFVDLKSKIDIIIKKYEVLDSQGFIFNFVVGVGTWYQTGREWRVTHSQHPDANYITHLFAINKHSLVD